MFDIISEEAYIAANHEQLSHLMCPNCQSKSLAQGGAHINCFECWNYFSEQEVIEANI